MAVLVGQGHEQHAAHARLQVFLCGVGRLAFQQRRQAGLQGFKGGGNVDFVMPHAHAPGHFARVLQADAGGVGAGHHHRAHLACAQRIDRQRQHQRRVNAARQPQQRLHKAVFARVVTQRQHQRSPKLAFG